MAIDEFTSQERSSIHRMLTLLNSSLQSVVLKLEQLSTSEVITPKYLEGLRKRSREIEGGTEVHIQVLNLNDPSQGGFLIAGWQHSVCS